MGLLWILLLPVVLIGGFFLVRSFARISKSLGELRTAMEDLAKAGEDLNKVREEVAKLGATFDEVRRQ